MKLKELSKDELVDLTTKLLKNIGAYPTAQHIVANFLLDRWNKKQDFLFEEAKKYTGFENFHRWEKIQREIDNHQNQIEYCTHFDELK